MVIHPTPTTPWAFPHRFKIVAHFSWPHDAQASLILEVLPCYPTACYCSSNQLATCMQSKLCTCQGVRRLVRAGRRGESNFTILISFIWGYNCKGRAVMCSHFPLKRLHSWVLLNSHWVKTGIFATWKIKLLWLGNSLLIMKHMEERCFLPILLGAG